MLSKWPRCSTLWPAKPYNWFRGWDQEEDETAKRCTDAGESQYTDRETGWNKTSRECKTALASQFFVQSWGQSSSWGQSWVWLWDALGRVDHLLLLRNPHIAPRASLGLQASQSWAFGEQLGSHVHICGLEVPLIEHLVTPFWSKSILKHGRFSHWKAIGATAIGRMRWHFYEWWIIDMDGG